MPIGLLCLVFVVSAALTFLDPGGTMRSTAKLGFPTFFVYPLAVAKLLGVAAVLSRRLRTLSHFAFAGFLFDMVLALSAHVHEHDFPAGWLAVAGLIIWVAAFASEHRRWSRELHA